MTACLLLLFIIQLNFLHCFNSQNNSRDNRKSTTERPLDLQSNALPLSYTPIQWQLAYYSYLLFNWIFYIASTVKIIQEIIGNLPSFLHVYICFYSSIRKHMVSLFAQYHWQRIFSNSDSCFLSNHCKLHSPFNCR